MLTSRYMTSVKNLPAIMQKIVDGAAPDKFTLAHLKGIGFKSSNDQGVIPILKDLKFLTADGSPTKRYLDYRDKSKSRQILGEALREAYEDIFHINEHPTEADRQAIIGRFKSAHNVTDAVAERQAMTFLALLKLADISGQPKHAAKPKETIPEKEKEAENTDKSPVGFQALPFSGLRYNIEIHLPATKDVEVYNAIFKSLRVHLLDD
jgi:hypothetical protein